MKTFLNLIIASSILVMMNDCEVNAGRTALNYSNSIYGLGAFVLFGFFRIYYKSFVEYLIKIQ